MSNVQTVAQMWSRVVKGQDMKSLPIGRKYNCEEAWWHMEEDRMSQKQRDQYRSYVSKKLDETLIEQANEQGEIFTDKYLHPQCEFIRVIKKDDGEGSPWMERRSLTQEEVDYFEDKTVRPRLTPDKRKNEDMFCLEAG